MARRYFNESSNIKPGVISDELREALGLSKKNLPIWIHRMRILGYPPGWLKKADMTNTTINFIDDNEDNGIEEGQVDTNINPNAEKMYNTDSFFEFPGFNSPVPKGVKDEYEKLGMPPMQEFQQLNYAKQTIQSIQPVPHRLFKLTDLKDKDEESSDSDESSDTDNNKETLNAAPDLTNKNQDSTINLSSNDKCVDIKDSYPIEEERTSETTLVSVGVLVPANKNQDSINLSSEDKCVDHKDSYQIEEERTSEVTLVSMGAPVPASLNGEKPPLENFAVGMGELIYFENLPTSTGVFDKMRKVIKKIRKKLSNTNSPDTPSNFSD